MRTVFAPHPLPPELAARVTNRVQDAHDREPFSPLDPRAAVRRLAGLLTDLGLHSAVFRGGLDLQGAEVDHVWLAVGEVEGAVPVSVLDLAFPLYDARFVGVLRRFVAGDAEPGELDEAARVAGIEARVIGAFPALMSYRGQPVWAER